MMRLLLYQLTRHFGGESLGTGPSSHSLIAIRSFESPASLVSPSLPLAPDAPDPLNLSFNHAVISLSQDNKGIVPVSCTAHDVLLH